MEKEEIKRLIDPYVVAGKIPCKKALEIAEARQISPKALGDILHELKIKVSACELGCFP